MARETTKWPSTRWPITKIMSSDGCNGNRVPLEMGPWSTISANLDVIMGYQSVKMSDFILTRSLCRLARTGRLVDAPFRTSDAMSGRTFS